MKKLHSYVDDMAAKVDVRWRRLPLRKQRLYTLLFSVGYLLLTIVVIADVCCGNNAQKGVKIEHIGNPTVKPEGTLPTKAPVATGNEIIDN